MEPSRFWKITHWIRGGNIGAVQRTIRETQRAYLDANKKNKMSCEYMTTLELDDLLDIQSKHSEGTPIYLRIQFELQRRINQDQIRAIYKSNRKMNITTLIVAFIGIFSKEIHALYNHFLKYFPNLN